MVIGGVMVLHVAIDEHNIPMVNPKASVSGCFWKKIVNGS
jgi:hypothetical protein